MTGKKDPECEGCDEEGCYQCHQYQNYHKPSFYTVKTVARKLNLSERGVQSLCKQGKLGHSKPGKAYLIPPESLDEYLKIRR